MIPSQLSPSNRARWEWTLYQKAYYVHQNSQNQKAIHVAKMIAYHMMGRHWCHEQGHHYVEKLDAIDWQVVDDEHHRLTLEKG